MFKKNHLCCAGKFLDELGGLWIVFCFDLCIVQESGMLCRVAEKLKSGGIKSVFVLLPPDVLNLDTANVFFPALRPFTGDGVSVYDSVSNWNTYRSDVGMGAQDAFYARIIGQSLYLFTISVLVKSEDIGPTTLYSTLPVTQEPQVTRPRRRYSRYSPSAHILGDSSAVLKAQSFTFSCSSSVVRPYYYNL